MSFQLLVDTIQLDQPVELGIPEGARTMLTLEQAAALPELGGRYTPAMLRRRIHAGDLPAEQDGRTFLITRDDINEWRLRCRSRLNPRDSGSGRLGPTRAGPLGSPSGSSGTERGKLARDVALETMRALLENSKRT